MSPFITNSFKCFIISQNLNFPKSKCGNTLVWNKFVKKWLKSICIISQYYRRCPTKQPLITLCLHVLRQTKFQEVHLRGPWIVNAVLMLAMIRKSLNREECYFLRLIHSHGFLYCVLQMSSGNFRLPLSQALWLPIIEEQSLREMCPCSAVLQWTGCSAAISFFFRTDVCFLLCVYF